MSTLLPAMGDLAPLTTVPERMPSLTYRLDLERKRIVGMVDDQEAVLQSIGKALITEQNAHTIYGNSGYGIAIDDLKGLDRFIVEAELRRRIGECLLSDDRILKVYDFLFHGGLDDLSIYFTVDTIYGAVRQERRFSLL
ncbi:MAG: DUF2634 domain-containing protein [Symbiobacteriaceae bacterium]|nr:DUF2634 domain-containing protein [Symbiobacteriaceae bacterium]